MTYSMTWHTLGCINLLCLVALLQYLLYGGAELCKTGSVESATASRVATCQRGRDIYIGYKHIKGSKERLFIRTQSHSL